ncbi:endonuclease/exonuclease/phosphatase family protein [Shewanella putrefaciens]|uniref:Endonuclease/exonuclease/phosphatase family protein n=1 Tax=Shewanella putrefaciens TaxID=24 RepID=A0ABX8X9L3_SHEPU|nr:endonuclease/exonuclease/phosphatase family protein [Shewanella putrefaciens]AVV85639.1 endonuclease [Shewanella putrefaciens]MCT8944862.1 endonuclease/exonuclease/phosphatase family protein [Shewanella putrefaciens]QSE48563.1 endonuclease/exonuclease/phosphatase family protein [Shewanella putrefaciens]QYX71969.1 endonuclease/exonuclease/phosphatase family protein [Shewanella putrefaciens]GGN25442.1 endonuclease [Shewanella putrefaciens]
MAHNIDELESVAAPIDHKRTANIKIASINLFNFIEPPLAYYDFENIYSHGQWQKKCQWLSEFLAHRQPDIVGFQEVFSPEPLKRIAREQGLGYFAVVDEPTLISDYIYRSPVVALASRYPIVEISSVEPDARLVAAMGLSSEFAFSRKVLRATVEVPHIGKCDYYVVHFKSKRAGLALEPKLFEHQPLGLDNLAPAASMKLHSETQLLTEQALGRWASTMQRGAEAALLFNGILVRRQESKHPVIVMGDFNDSLTMGALDALTIQGESIHSNDIKAAGFGHLSDAALAAVFAQYQLKDAYELFIEANLRDSLTGNTAYHREHRAATHYYGPKGSVLDYILLSSEFDASHGRSLAQVVDYQTCDRHLVRPEYERDAYSTDHAPVIVELALRS